MKRRHDSMEELKRVQRKDRIELNELDQDECSSSRKIPKHEVPSDEDDNELLEECAKEIPRTDSIGMRLMQKSGGWEVGRGLGRKEQGITKPIEASGNIGRGGFGLKIESDELDDTILTIASTDEIKTIDEFPLWLSCDKNKATEISKTIAYDWIKTDKPKFTIDDEDRYCDLKLLKGILKLKACFDGLESRTLNDARARANPYETIKSGFFQNRAAMKTANIDKIFEWRLSMEHDATRRKIKNPDFQCDRTNTPDEREKSLFYFADICAGPGGFSEYLLWRKGFYNAKGIGFTLTGKDDFKLDKFKASSSEYLETYYGEKNDGNVLDPANLDDLEKFVKERTRGSGVQLVMCDGGFSVEGRENIQEILSKRLYLCQFITGVSLCRSGDGILAEISEGKSRKNSGGNFLCKLFDVFTPFSVGLLYLLYLSFERISIHKPLTSRPANSERYVFCEGLTQAGLKYIKPFLKAVNEKLNTLYGSPQQAFCPEDAAKDIVEIVPYELIQADTEFCNYIKKSNEGIARRQIFYLNKYREFTKNHGVIDFDQETIRENCLQYWELPNLERMPQVPKPPLLTLGEFAIKLHSETESSYPKYPLEDTPRFNLSTLESLTAQLKDINTILRAAFIPQGAYPMLIISQGAENLYGLSRDKSMDRLDGYKIPLPRDTILLAQLTEVYERKIGADGRETIEAIRDHKVLYVIDAAVLNGDDVADLRYSTRLAAARKFCDAVNKLQIRRPVYEQFTGRRSQQRRFVRYDPIACDELVCANPRPLSELINAGIVFRGSQAMLPISLSSRSQQISDKKMYIPVKAVHILRNTALHKSSPLDFYEHLTAVNQKDISSGPRFANTWHWQWEENHQLKFGVHNIVNDEMPMGEFLTLKYLHKRASNHHHHRHGPPGNNQVEESINFDFQPGQPKCEIKNEDEDFNDQSGEEP